MELVSSRLSRRLILCGHRALRKPANRCGRIVANSENAQEKALWDITPVRSRPHHLGETAHTVDEPGSGFAVIGGRLRHSTEHSAPRRYPANCRSTYGRIPPLR
jgi:hypothetical protein